MEPSAVKSHFGPKMHLSNIAQSSYIAISCQTILRIAILRTILQYCDIINDIAILRYIISISLFKQYRIGFEKYRTGIISMSNADIHVDLTIEAFWIDEQLQQVKTLNLINLPTNVATKLWHPWISFKNCKNCKNLLIDPNEITFYLIGKHIGVENRKTFSFTCIFDLSNYPFDKQQCNINVELSYWNGPINIEIDKRDFFGDLLVPPEYWLVSSDQVLTTCDENAGQNSKLLTR
uniref:Neurotransmitter-gated ion-channel ligand-binding domain-containing protein n=1 Tax=Strigamia maritima TaxID=126957 RepID=T1J028_STRMM